MSHQMSKKIKAKNKHGNDRKRGAARASILGSYSRKRSEYLRRSNYGYRDEVDNPNIRDRANDKPNSYQARKQKRKQKRRGDFDSLGSLFS